MCAHNARVFPGGYHEVEDHCRRPVRACRVGRRRRGATGEESQGAGRRHLELRGRRDNDARRQKIVSIRRDAQGHSDLHGRRPLCTDPCRQRRAQDRVQQPHDRYARGIRRDHAAQAAGSGTYTIDEANKTVTYNIVSASFPNWEGEAQTRTIDKLTADEFVNTNPGVAGGRGSASNLYRRVK